MIFDIWDGANRSVAYGRASAIVAQAVRELKEKTEREINDLREEVAMLKKKHLLMTGCSCGSEKKDAAEEEIEIEVEVQSRHRAIAV